ncbi:MAG: NAD(P)/FAD-dependent oxidoreductase [Acidimicrobiales bacterium]|jgi:cation diffusion facilitator CzcD-associated flavoprotein CzcO|nr:NAD(P)/FAD-dependent oxidoreductase [Acidimicrobiales bacterium]
MEHLDVLVVGAGLSGIAAGHHLQTDTPWVRYAVFESREAIGGTWDLFRYPGIRSDSDMHTLGYPFRPWTGERSIADGGDILRYLRDTAVQEGIDRRIRFGHRVVAADWRADEAVWHVRAERGDTAETVQLTCSFLFSCCGYYRYDRGHVPEFAGMEDFAGRVVHPQFWPDELDVVDRRVVVIGSGATAITLVPALADRGAHVTMLQRSPTYVASVPTRNPVAAAVRRALPSRAAAVVLRWLNAVTTQSTYWLSRRRPEVVKRALRRGLERQLPAGYDIDTHFTPRYDPWDQRLCAVADGDLFRAIREGRVDVVTDTVDRFTETGILLGSGRALEADLVVPATGLELLFAGGINLSIDGEPIDVGSKLAYKGMMLEGVPNFAVAVGYTNASWTLKADLTCGYVCRLLTTMRRRGRRVCTPVDRDGDGGRAPLLGLSSGYIQRAADRFPAQGSRFPWRVHQSYLRDYVAMRLRGVDDRAMVFSEPASMPASSRAAGAA